MAELDPTPADPESEVEGVGLTQSFGLFGLEGIESLDLSDRNNSSFVPVPLHDDHIEGSIPTKGVKQIRFASFFANASFSALRASADDMQTKMFKGKNDFKQYSDRVIPAHLRTVRKRISKNGMVLEYDVGLVAEEQFSFAPNLTQTFALSDGTKFSVHNPGHVATPLIFRFSPSGVDATMIKLQNTTSEKDFAFNRTVTLGDLLVVDTVEKTVRIQATSGILNFFGDWVEMLRGTNHYQYNGSTVTLELNTNHRYFF